MIARGLPAVAQSHGFATATPSMPLPLFRLPRTPSATGSRRCSRARPRRPRGTCPTGSGLPGREGEPTAAAVLVPLVNRPQGLQVLLTQRSADLPDHPGQISFPGGRVEPDDASLAAAALREATEEVGLPAARVSVLGHLADYETVTGFRVTPVVGWVEPPFALTPDPVEVADVFEVPLAFLLDPANQQRHFRMLGTLRRDYWAIPYGERYIWGATAAMLLILDRTLREARRLTPRNRFPACRSPPPRHRRRHLQRACPRTASIASSTTNGATPPIRASRSASTASAATAAISTCSPKRLRRRTACWPSTCPAAARATGWPTRTTTCSRPT